MSQSIPAQALPTPAAAVVRLVQLHEDLRLHPYRDSQGFWTIGWGRNLDALGLRRPEVLRLLQEGKFTEPQALEMLLADLSRTVQALTQAVPCFSRLSPVRQAVLLDMAYNLGINRLLQFKEFLACVAARRWTEAGAAMLDSKWARQVGQRAHRLKAMLESDTWPPDLPSI